MRRSEGGSLSGKEKNVNTERNVLKYFKFNRILTLLNIMRVFILTQLLIKEFVPWFSLRHGLN